MVDEQVEERLGRERLGAEHADAAHAPVASSSRATTGLIAVCHTTACEPSRAMVSSLSARWYRYTSRGAPSLPVPVTQVPAHVRPRMRSPSAGGVGQAGGDDVARRHLACRAP